MLRRVQVLLLCPRWPYTGTVLGRDAGGNRKQTGDSHIEVRWQPAAGDTVPGSLEVVLGRLLPLIVVSGSRYHPGRHSWPPHCCARPFVTGRPAVWCDARQWSIAEAAVGSFSTYQSRCNSRSHKDGADHFPSSGFPGLGFSLSGKAVDLTPAPYLQMCVNNTLSRVYLLAIEKLQEKKNVSLI